MSGVMGRAQFDITSPPGVDKIAIIKAFRTRMPGAEASIRFVLGQGGTLHRRPNIRKWDEEPELLETRKAAIEDWA